MSRLQNSREDHTRRKKEKYRPRILPYHYDNLNSIVLLIGEAIQRGEKPAHLQLPYFARKFRMDKELLRTIFRKRYGIPFRDYVTLQRLNYLKQLLRGPKQVKVLSIELGYRKPCVFSTEFKRLSGIGPREYRNSSID